MKTLTIDKTAMDTNHQHIPSQLSAAIHAKCPKCRTGNMFQNRMYSFKGQKMYEECPHCGFHFEIEPGYFYVAMFVSYAINVALMVTVAVGTYILTKSENPWVYAPLVLIAAFASSPFNFRYSRVILLYWLTPGLHYDPNRARRNSSERKVN
jgi:uncharacterized protein (DUF983 family)